MKKILSIDGGGIRGIVAAQILIAIEARLPKGKLICDYIDLFAGTSTGGILTILINTGKYTAQQASDMYVNNAKNIFKKNRFSFFGLLAPKYDHKGIEDCLHQYFQNMQLSQLKRACIVSSYDIANRKTRFFSKDDKQPYYVKDVCRATSAAETYFKPHPLGNMVLTDGGTACNNPTMCANSEMINKGYKPNELFIISIGTGTVELPYKNNNWGKVKWVQPIIDILMAASSEIVDFHLKMIYSSNQYIRIQTCDFANASVEMDCVSDENIQSLIAMGKKMALKFNKEIDKIVDVLLNK